MPGSSFGNIFRLHTFGESHGTAIGGIIDGCPSGLKIDFEFIKHELFRRKTHQGIFSTTRKEDDDIKFLSGVFNGTTLGTPIAFIIENKNQKSSDYESLKGVYRPSHADYTYDQKYKVRDYRGGGRSSARETVARVVGGAIAKLLLKSLSIEITAYVSEIGTIIAQPNISKISAAAIEKNILRCPDNKASQSMLKLIETAQKKGDTLGGVVSCCVKGVPAGWGEPVFNKLNAELAKAMFSINAVKGFELGGGFDMCKKFGSEVNDEMFSKNQQIKFKSNNSGGIQGGISNGNDITMNIAFKPIASIKKSQKSISVKKENIQFNIVGRHDVCILPRAVPIVESMAALVLADAYLLNKCSTL